MSEFVKTLSDEDLKKLREQMLVEYRRYRGTNNSRFALDRLIKVDEEYCDRELSKRIEGFTGTERTPG